MYHEEGGRRVQPDAITTINASAAPWQSFMGMRLAQNPVLS
jgi:hypothetical protein